MLLLFLSDPFTGDDDVMLAAAGDLLVTLFGRKLIARGRAAVAGLVIAKVVSERKTAARPQIS